MSINSVDLTLSGVLGGSRTNRWRMTNRIGNWTTFTVQLRGFLRNEISILKNRFNKPIVATGTKDDILYSRMIHSQFHSCDRCGTELPYSKTIKWANTGLCKSCDLALKESMGRKYSDTPTPKYKRKENRAQRILDDADSEIKRKIILSY